MRRTARKGSLELREECSEFLLFHLVFCGSLPVQLVARGRQLHLTGECAGPAVPNLVETGSDRFWGLRTLPQLGSTGVRLGVYFLVCGVVFSSTAEVRVGPAGLAGVEAILGELSLRACSRFDCEPQGFRAQCSVTLRNSDMCGGFGSCLGISLRRPGALDVLGALSLTCIIDAEPGQLQDPCQ